MATASLVDPGYAAEPCCPTPGPPPLASTAVRYGLSLKLFRLIG